MIPEKIYASDREVIKGDTLGVYCVKTASGFSFRYPEIHEYLENAKKYIEKKDEVFIEKIKQRARTITEISIYIKGSYYLFIPIMFPLAKDVKTKIIGSASSLEIIENAEDMSYGSMLYKEMKSSQTYSEKRRNRYKQKRKRPGGF